MSYSLNSSRGLFKGLYKEYDTGDTWSLDYGSCGVSVKVFGEIVRAPAGLGFLSAWKEDVAMWNKIFHQLPGACTRLKRSRNMLNPNP